MGGRCLLQPRAVGHPDLIVPLLEAGANIDRATYDATFTALHHAIAKAHWDCARILIDKGAALNELNEGGCFGTSLHYAVYQGNEEFTKLILSKGGDVNSCASGIVPDTPPSKQERAAVVHREI